MKKFICVAICLLALKLTPAFGQDNKLITFNLDFPGGTPADLVKAIESATGKPLNAIIPTEDADTQLPPLKMNEVNVAQLFQALEKASVKDIRYVSSTFFGQGGQSYSVFQSYYSFSTEANPATDSSIWYFHVARPTMPTETPREICKFYQLQPYLNHGFTVDDITTAIQTGWKMAGITSPPELNYHKETNLLIVCGKPDDLATIQSVLDQLPKTSIDNSQLVHFYDEAGKVKEMQSQIEQLSKRLDALTANSSEKNSGK